MPTCPCFWKIFIVARLHQHQSISPSINQSLNKCSAAAEMGDRLPQQTRAENGGGLCPFTAELGFQLMQCGLGRGLSPYQLASWFIQPFDHNTRPKNGGLLCPLLGRGAESPSNTMWPGPGPTSVPSFILIHPTVWPQYTNVTDRQNRQRSDSIGGTVLQPVAQKLFWIAP